MSSHISYPFAAIPNHIVRGGHGITNLAVLAVIISHGECFASVKTLARELGCNEKTIKKSIKYWRDNANKHGFSFTHTERKNSTNLIQVIFHDFHSPSTLGPTTHPNQEPPPSTLGPLRRTPEEDILKQNPPISPLGDSSASTAELEYRQEYPPRGLRDTPPPKVPQKGSAPDYELNKQVQLLEDVFYRANPAYNFKNKGYKEACKELIRAYGIEKAVFLADLAIRIQSRPYAPRVSTPIQLRDKAIEVQAFAMQEQDKHTKSQVIIAQ